MKQLSATASATTPATLERCFELVSAIDQYPTWYPAGVTAAQVTERDAEGQPTRAHVELHVAHGILVRDFSLNVVVLTRRLESVKIERIRSRVDDSQEFAVAWALAGGEQIQIAVRMHANLSIPGFLPVGGVAESVANGFLKAALDALS
jgi:ribosome-associated toxin RatA of RatAB toxin-antitoxin module